MHLDYLTKEETLETQAGRTLEERCALFEALFKPKRLCASTLRRIYLKNKISRKAVRKVKAIPVNKAGEYQQWKATLLEKMDTVELENRKIIYVDEVMFTKKACLDKAYSHKYTNLAVNQDDLYASYTAVLAAVSEETGVEHLFLSPNPINEENFNLFTHQLCQLNEGKKLALFMDNLWFHKTGGMKEVFQDLDIFPLYNIPNCPETAPIEACFSIVKCHYKRMRLQCLVNDKPFDAEQHIRAAFD